MKVFISGSRNIKNLNQIVYDYLNMVIQNNYCVLVGDCYGVDYLVQKYFNDESYDNVIVYCSGDSPRNNIGNWKVISIPVPPIITKKEFYAFKDRQMCLACDFGLVIWDGKSTGSYNNIKNLTRLHKSVFICLVS